MQLELGEAFEIWVMECSEEDVDVKRDVLWKPRGPPAELVSLVEVSDEVHDSLRLGIWVVGLYLSFVHLVIGFLNDMVYEMADGELLVDG